MRALWIFAATFPAAALLCTDAIAQELTPRAYWPLPNGANVAVVSYQHNTGDIVTDPSLPLIGVDSVIDYLQVSYQRTFGLLGRSANLQLNLPYSSGHTEGIVAGEFRTRDTSGFTDARVLLSINLRGAPSMDAAALQDLLRNPRTIVGASVLVQAPTGEYEPDKAINLGTNRWSVKPAIGVIWPLHPTWLLEFDVGAWFFGTNDEFLGQTREQDPILSTEIHVVKQIRPGLWAALDANYYVGGRTTIGDEVRADLQRNSRFGATVFMSITRRHAIRGSFSTGVVTESGGDFNIVSVSYLYSW